MEYEDSAANAFVISGYLNVEFPVDTETLQEIKPRVSSKRRFDSEEEAEAWAQRSYKRICKNLSNPGIGVWAFLVEPKQDKATAGSVEPKS